MTSGRPDHPVDVSALVDHGPWTGYQKLLTGFAAVAVVFDGFDIQILAFAIPSLLKEWRLARQDFGPVLGLGLAGMAIGSPLAGYLGDRFGRRPAMIASIALFALATLATVFAEGIVGLAILRFLTGIGAGGAVPNATALAAEFAPLRRRPTAVKLTIVCIPLGGMLGGLIAAQVLPVLGWKALYLIGGAAPLAFAIVLWFALPESPRFLVRHPERWSALRQQLRRMGHRVADDAGFEDRVEQASAGKISLRALFSPTLRRDTIGLWIAFFFCLQGVYLVFGWLPAMLSAQGMNIATASSGLAAYNFGGVLGVVLWTLLTSLWGSRIPMLGGALAGAVTALALVAVHAGGDASSLVIGIGVHGLVVNAVQTSMFALAAHVYPAVIRASGVAYAASVGRIGAILCSVFGAWIIQAGAAAYWHTLAALMLMAFLGLVSIRRHIPANR